MGKKLLWLVGILILVFLIIKIAPLLILNINYSSTFGPEIAFRNQVMNILEKKMEIPEKYNFYIDTKYYGGEIPRRVYLMHFKWVDKQGFDYLVDVESDELLIGIHKITPTITKDSDYNLSFKDYVPWMYFGNSMGGFDFEGNNYAKEESIALEKIRNDVNHVLKSNNRLDLTALALPAVNIYGVAGTPALAVAVISKGNDDYIYEYDYNGDGKIDEIKRFATIQDQSIVLEDLANRLGIKYEDLKESYSFGGSNDLTAFAKFVDEDGLNVEVTIDQENKNTRMWIGYEDHQFYEKN